MYAALNRTQNHSGIIDLRELCGGGVFQMPASITVMHDRSCGRISRIFSDPSIKSAGSDEAVPSCLGLAGRQQQYEIYAGASFIIRNHSFREAPWEHFDGVVDNPMGTRDIPEPILAAAERLPEPSFRRCARSNF